MDKRNLQMAIPIAVVVLLVAVLGACALGFALGGGGGAQVAPIVVPQTGGAPFVYGAPYARPWGGFGFLGCLFPFLMIFLVFGVLRFLFWGGMGWKRGWHRRDWKNGTPPMFEEWHRRAHGEPAAEDPNPAAPTGTTAHL